MPQRCENIGIDLSGKDHLCHFEGRVVSDAATLDDRLLDPKLFGEVAELFATAVNNTDANANLMQKRELFSKRSQIVMVLRDLAREFDDKRLPFEALDVR